MKLLVHEWRRVYSYERDGPTNDVLNSAIRWVEIRLPNFNFTRKHLGAILVYVEHGHRKGYFLSLPMVDTLFVA